MTVWERAPEVVWRRSGVRRLVVGPASDEVVVMEGSGQLIWDLLEHPISEGDLVATLSDAFDESADQLRPDVLAFLTELSSAGLVTAR